MLGLDDLWSKKIEFKIPSELHGAIEKDALLEILRKKGIEIPRDTTLKPYLHDNVVRSLHYSVYVEQIAQNERLIIAERRNILGDLMGLHENEGKPYFAFAEFGFALTLLILSGIFITILASKKERKEQILAICAGCVLFGILGILSVS